MGLKEDLTATIEEAEAACSLYASKEELFELRQILAEHHKEIMRMIDDVEVRIVFAHQMYRHMAEDRLGKSYGASLPLVGLPSTKVDD